MSKLKIFLQTKYLFFSLFLITSTLSPEAFAQISPQIRRLPPSLERELKLRKGGKTRIIGFIDTLKAENLIAQSLRDTTSEELDSTSVRDTAIIMIDSSVSLSDKEWLDSMLAELPEYHKTPDGVRFQYPAEILVETTRKVVPEDTTLASKIDPVTKEDLPLYEEMPMPRPLSQKSLPGTSVELGAGAPYLPQVDLRSLVISNEKSLLELTGKYLLTSAEKPAIKQYWKIGASGNFLFPDASPSSAGQVPQLNISIATGANKRLLVSQIDSAEHTLSLTNLDAGFTIGSPSQLSLRSNASLSLLSDDVGSNISEDLGRADLSLLKDISSSYRVQLDIRYQAAGRIQSKLRTDNLSLFETKFIVQQKESSTFQWKAGLSYLSGSDAGGGTSQLSPLVNLKLRLSHAFEIGADFEPENKLIGLQQFTATNLFYSPLISKPNDSLHDPRRIVSEPVHLNLFANYFLSLDDEIHTRLSFIERNNEPTFYSDTDMKGHTIFIATPINTRRIELEAGGSLLLFRKDKLRASLLFRSATDRSNGSVLPYEPTAQIQAIYQFGNISEKFIPQIELIRLDRFIHSFTFLNLEMRYTFTPEFQLKFRAENILGNAGDFWTGYDEYPRSAWLSLRYAF